MTPRKSHGASGSFEDSLQKLEAIVRRLEEEELPLEQSLKLFAEGQALSRACEDQLRAAENQVKLLIENAAGAIAEAPLDPRAAASDEDDPDETTPPSDAEDPPESPPRPAPPRNLKDDLPF